MINWFNHEYPYTNFHELNLDWIINTMKRLVDEVNNFVALNTIKYANPIQWNITTQYEKNTVVVDPITGTAYISTQPVPSGIGLNNTDYWNVIFTLDIISANKNITLHDDANNILATFESAIGDWLLWQGTLYKVTRQIDIGNAYVDDYNITRYTVEMFIHDYIDTLSTTITTIIGDLDDLSTTDKTSIVNAINEVVNSIGDLDDLDTSIKTSIVNAINDVVGSMGDLDDLNTTDKTSLVNAINEVINSIGDLDNLNTTDKNSLVNAINEVITSMGDLSDLDTTDKDSIVNAINEIFNKVDDVESTYLHYVYVESYLDTLSDTDALKQAINDCPSKGCVILPPQTLNISDTIVINKPLTIKGSRHGFFQLEGGNNFTPNSDYITYDLNFSALSECFTIASPSVSIEDINIKFSPSVACKIFNLTSASGDNLNMPRDIRFKNVNVINSSLSNPTNAIYGIYAHQPVLLSEFDHVTFGWVTYGFYFDANINTSITFKRCGVTCTQAGYYLANATYCNFYNCGCESQNPNGFYITGCKCITILNCYCEQITGVNFNIVSSYSVVLLGCFCTSGTLIKTSLSSGCIIACQSSITSTSSTPWLDLYGSYMKLLGMSDCYITTDNGNTTRRIGYSDKIVKFEANTYVGHGFTPTGMTINSFYWSMTDNHVRIYIDFTTTGTSATLSLPAYMLPVRTDIFEISPTGWGQITYNTNSISLHVSSAGQYTSVIEFDSIATQ